VNDRTRIAQELLDAAKTIDKIDNSWLCDDPAANRMLAIDHIIGWKQGCAKDYTFTQLAKLIDPTCYLEYREWIPNGGDECDLEWEWRCSNCGETFCADPDGINAPIDWTYCPNCGYRIIETNSGEDNNSER
jgi:hypothetical protein